MIHANDIIVILTGLLVAVSCSIVGTWLVLRQMAMVGDAISHAVLPGIVLAFLFTGTRSSLTMFWAAALMGLLATFMMAWMQRRGVQADASLGVVFTALFAGGVLLIAKYADKIDLDLDCVLYGEMHYAPWMRLAWMGIDLGVKPLWTLGFTLVVIVAVVGLFYKQFKLCAFDPAMAAATGVSVATFHFLLMGLVSMTTVASFESVGAILVLGMLVIPPATAYLCTDRLSTLFSLAVLFGACSTIGGYVLATAINASISGCMVVVATGLFACTALFSPRRGMVFAWVQRRTNTKHG